MMAAILASPERRSSTGHGVARPSERVTRMIEDRYLKNSNHEKVRLPTVRELAEQAGVSTATVQKVYRELTLRGVVVTEVGNGTFLLPRQATESGELVVALNIRPPDPVSITTEWHTRIYGGMMSESMRSGCSVRFQPLSQEVSGAPSVDRDLIEEIAEVDALALLFPSTGCEVTEAYRRAGKPVVSVIAPSPHATANFVSPDFFTIAETIGLGLTDCGRRNFVLLLPSPVRERVSSQQWLSGLINGVSLDKHPDVTLRILSAGGFSERDGREAMKALLAEGRTTVDAVCCSGDFLALGAAQALRDAGLTIPDDVSVIGGSGLDLHASPDPYLTRIRQPLEEVGAKLFETVVRMIREKETTVPGEYLPCSLIGGGTTTEVENRRFDLPGTSPEEQ